MINRYVVIAAIAFATVLVCSMYILRVRIYSGPDNPATLREDYWSLPEAEARTYLWEYREASFKTNLELANRKGRALSFAIPALAVEVVFLIAWLLAVSLT